ncbi:uncharacterized protein [Drosophila bipectinata]|uniref:uncharacterized protein n=1 Tax=Drosophila bipectinata TaxID=42026 RepID=UPI0038B39210
MDPNKNKKPKHKLVENKLEVMNDVEFIRNILKDMNVDSSPQARGVLLDLAYTLARDHLVEADRLAKMDGRTTISVEDIKMSKQVEVPKVFKPPPPDNGPSCSNKSVKDTKMGKPDLVKKMANTPPLDDGPSCSNISAKDIKMGKHVPVKKMAITPPPDDGPSCSNMSLKDIFMKKQGLVKKMANTPPPDDGPSCSKISVKDIDMEKQVPLKKMAKLSPPDEDPKPNDELPSTSQRKGDHTDS